MCVCVCVCVKFCLGSLSSVEILTKSKSQWTITFNDHSKYNDPMSKVPILGCNSTLLTGTYSKCDFEYTNPIRNPVRGKAHVFTRNSDQYLTGSYIEQCFLYPNIPQRQDMFGSTVAVSGTNAIIGAPNRDLVNVNSGAALVFDIGFLEVSERSERALMKTRIRATTKLTLFLIHFGTFFTRRSLSLPPAVIASWRGKP